MQLNIKLLLAQLMIKTLISLIQSGMSSEKDSIIIGLDAVSILSIFGVYVMNYLQMQDLYKYMLIEIITLLQLEFYFYTKISFINSVLLFYLLEVQILILQELKYFNYFVHSYAIYVLIRLIGQFFYDLTVFQIMQFIIWFPLNHYLIYKNSYKPSDKQQLMATPNVSLRKNAKQHSFILENDQKVPDQQNSKNNSSEPDNQSSLKSSINDEILNCLPYGLVLLDKDFTVIKHNPKILNYLSEHTIERLPMALNKLMQKAEIHNAKSPIGRRRQNIIIPLKNLKQSSAGPTKMLEPQRDKNWISDRTQKREQIVQSFRDSKLHSLSNIVAEFQKKGQINLSSSFTQNSEFTNVLRYQVVLEVNDKQKNYQITVYEVDITSQSAEPVYLFIVENITNKERLKELTNRYRFQKALLNSFSHELRTPLNCTLSILAGLGEKLGQELIENYLSPAIVSSKRLLLQINDILDYAQLECKDFKLNPVQFQIQTIFDEIKYLFLSECQQKQIEFIIDQHHQGSIYNDKDRIIQVLVNLINNSIKFTKQNGRIIVSLKRQNSKYNFCVWDNGQGISSDKLLTLYTPQQYHFEYNSKTSHKLGVGLRVSQGITKYLSEKGELFIKSQEGCFTSISFFVDDLKRNIQLDYQYVLESNRLIEQEESTQKVYINKSNFLMNCECPQILIVDDIPFNHIALSALLSSYSKKVDSAYDGEQAIQKVTQRLSSSCCKFYKIIFMDIEMPGMDGFETSKKITNLLHQNEILSNYIIVMCSAYTGEGNLDQANKCGMFEIMPKPISIESLQRVINKYLIN